MNRTEIGDSYSFTPTCMVTDQGTGNEVNKMKTIRKTVTGTVVQVHREHHWFRVRFRLPGVDGHQYETFKTADPPDFLPCKHGHRQPGAHVWTDLTEY